MTAPARNGPLDPETETDVKADDPGFRAARHKRATAFGASYPRAHPSALAVSDNERDEILERRWDIGGFAMLGWPEYVACCNEVTENDSEGFEVG